ncbi:hypothetical protein CALCODRAFT_498643, partial [Calocera cornea HHB12733]
MMAGRERILGLMFAACVGVASGIYAFKEPLREEAEQGLFRSAPSDITKKGQVIPSNPTASEVTTAIPNSDSRKAGPDTPKDEMKTDANSAESATASS